MTLRQIMEHKRNGLTVKVNGLDVTVAEVYWREDRVMVRYENALCAIVKFTELTSNWAGEWTPAGE